MGASSSLFSSMIFTVLAVYYVQVVGMNALQLVLVGTVLELTILAFEVPTGVVADAYSRRISVIIGYTLVGLCFVIEGMVPIFAAILLAEFIRGVGETFISGAAMAWIADELGEERVGRAYLRYGQLRQAGGLAGIILGAGLATIRLDLPITLGGLLLMCLSLFLLLTMQEHSFTPVPRGERSSWQTMLGITRDGVRVVRRQPVVLMFLLVAVVFGAFSEGFDRLWEAHFLLTFSFPTFGKLEPVVWIGIINASSMLLGILMSELVIRRFNLQNQLSLGRALLLITALLIASVIAFGLAPGFATAVVAFWVAGALRTLQYPIAATWLNRHIHSRVHAAVLSMVSQADALGQIAGGPIVGVVGLRSLPRGHGLCRRDPIAGAYSLWTTGTCHGARQW